VLQNVKSPGNRLNGFQSEGQLSVTWLKPGVNKKEQITFEAKPYIHLRYRHKRGPSRPHLCWAAMAREQANYGVSAAFK